MSEQEQIQVICHQLIANVDTPNLQKHRDLAAKIRKKYGK